MRVTGTIRGISAIVILLSVFLPVTKCSHPFGGGTKYEYSWDGGWALLFVFFWPVFFVLIRRSIRHLRTTLLVRILEPLMAAASLYLLSLQTLFTSGLAIGGLVAFWSLACFGLASLTESTIEIVRWRRYEWKRA